MKLDTKALRHLTPEDWRVLQAVESGSKSHEIVPTPTIDKLSRLRGGSNGVHRSISNLAKAGLISRVREAKYDGYRLTYGGLDYLALHSHSQKRHVYSVGTRIGVGKESDIMIVADERGTQRVLKIHRLGRISFRTVKANRDYLNKRRRNQEGSGGWMYLSRLAAMKEYAFMQALREDGFPVPEPFAQSRHTIVMSLVESFPLRQISAVPDPAGLYGELIALILRLAEHGLIHGDFNEFNILIKEVPRESKAQGQEPNQSETAEGTKSEDDDAPALVPILIDFPQMVSMDHENAEMYFDRDVNCIKRFFERRFHFVSTQPGPFFGDAKKSVGKNGARRIDAAVVASGFTKKMAKDLEAAIREQEASRGQNQSDSEGEDEDDDDEEDGDEGLDAGEVGNGGLDDDQDHEVNDTATSRSEGATDPKTVLLGEQISPADGEPNTDEPSVRLATLEIGRET